MKLSAAAHCLTLAVVFAAAVVAEVRPARAEQQEFQLTPYAATDPLVEQAVLLSGRGEWKQAVRKLLKAESVPLPSRRYLAAVWLGRAGQERERRSRLVEVARADSPLAARAALELGRDLAERHQTEDALRSLAQAAGAPGTAADALRARVALLAAGGRPEEALEAAGKALEHLPTARERSDLLLSLGAPAGGEESCARRVIYDRYFGDSPRAAQEAITRAWGEEAGDVAILRDALFGSGRVTDLPESRRSGTWEAALLQGGGHRQARGRKEEALAAFVEARRLASTPLRQGAAMYLEARTLEGLDRDLDAAEVFSTLLRDLPDFPLRRDIEMRLATIAVREGQPLRAVDRLRTYLASACPGEDVAQALWLSGFVEYLSGRPESALQHWERLQRSYFYDASFGWVLYGATAIYWQARSLERAGKPKEAAERYRVLATEFAGAWYAVAARARLAVLGVDLPPPGAARLERSPAEAPSSLLLPTEYAAAAELFRLGLWAPAAEEIRRLLPLTGPPAGIAALVSSAWLRSRSLHETVEYRRSFGLMPPPWENGSRFWRRSLPLAFPEAIRHGYRASGLDPALTAAIIRFESDYNPRCASRAGAYGLLQVKENTGSHVAANCLNEKPVKRRELFDPLRNLQLGSIYIAGLMARHHGNRPVTLAAYNAGPGTAGWWLERFSGLSTDAFIEQITYPNTVGYVKRILGVTPLYWSLYHPLLGVEPPMLDVPEAIPSELGPFLDPAKGCPKGSNP